MRHSFNLPLAPRFRRGVPRRSGPLLGRLLVAGTLGLAGGAWGADIAEIYAEAVNKDPVLAGQRASAASRQLGVTIARSSLLPQANANAGRYRRSLPAPYNRKPREN